MYTIEADNSLDLAQLPRGFYSNNDCRVLSGTIKANNIRRVLEIGGRSGRTTTIMSRAVGPNGLIVCYERDESWWPQLEVLGNVEVRGNVIDMPPSDLTSFDMVFIDGYHDQIFAGWYVDNLLSRCTTQLMHIHDMHFPNYDLDDLLYYNNRHRHPDIVDYNTYKNYYPPEVSEVYYRGPDRWEGDIVRDWVRDNGLDWHTTYSKKGSGGPRQKCYDTHYALDCALYVWRPQ